MEDTVEEILFETRRHASGPYYSNYPPQSQLNEGRGGRLLTYIPFRGILQVKEKWGRYKKPRKPRKSVSLFVSSRGYFVAVASGNQIIILQKDNDYQSPIGTFTCENAGSVTCGAWSESHELLGFSDDTNTIYIVRPSGEEITRITKQHLNISLPVIGLIVLDDGAEKKSCSYAFTVFVSDGSLHHIEISKPNASVSSVQVLDRGSTQRQAPLEVFCWDYNPELSLLTIVSSAGDPQSTSDEDTGSFAISVWRRQNNLKLDRLVFTKFEGAYFMPQSSCVDLTSPKSLFSPGGKYIATIDMKGCLYIFQFDEQLSYISKLADSKSSDSETIFYSSSAETEVLRDIVDFTWWSNDVLIVAKRNGTITYVGVLIRLKISGSSLNFSTPILERALLSPGLIFILDSTLPEKTCSSLEEEVACDLVRSMKWSLATLLRKSPREIYDNLIAGQKYEAAFDFAEHHGFDQDEVLKSQWLSSVQGVREIKTILANIKDQGFVLSECVDKVGPTEDAVHVLLSVGLRLTDGYRFSDSEDNEDGQIWDFRLARLKLLQFKDRLETFIGINMGRFSMQGYKIFRNLPIRETALALAESGKIGALNLLFKRHPCSLIISKLEVLAAIPETIPVQTYEQLLPAVSAPSRFILRDEDWVECERMLRFIKNSCGDRGSSIELMTEPIIMKHLEYKWPSASDLSSWYRKRATDIDSFTGQLDNSMCLIDLAVRKGLYELQEFQEDIFYLQQLVYPDVSGLDMNFSMSLASWKQLPDYEKFKLIMMDVKDHNVIPRLQKIAVPFMLKRLHAPSSDEIVDKNIDSFLVRWIKEIASQNRLDMCVIIVEEGCRNMVNQFFKNEIEVMDCGLQCIYLCTDVDSWNTMSTILQKLRQLQEPEPEAIKQSLKLAEGHVEAGRLLSHYQVPKPISFILDAHTNEKGVKHIIRLFLSKFIRFKPGRTDHDWANLWRDLQSLREKAFPFLELEFLLLEFCRGLLKAGKFSLARNYLKGTSSITLETNKAENLVIQAAREYFYSAPSLACPEIWKAKECLDIFPSSRLVQAEADVIDAVTVRLPNLGVNLLPMAFRQIKEPMGIVKLAITSQSGAYLKVDEIIDIAKLLGLSSQEDLATVQEAVAREAAYAGDVQFAFDLCLVLAKKGHGSVWDLCAALARSQALENLDPKSQKLLLGFALSHCDEESMAELLHEWKDLDMQDNCITLSTLTGRELPGLSEQLFPNTGHFSARADSSIEDHETQIAEVKSLLSRTVRNLPSENDYDWETVLRENSKVFSSAASQLPWLLKLSEDLEVGKGHMGSVLGIQHFTVRTRAVMTALAWLTRNDFSPSDDVIASLARSIMEPPVSDEEDLLGCSVLLNLTDAFNGAEIVEEQLKMRGDYREFSSLMNAGMIYSLLHSHDIECANPAQRRELLQSKFHEKHKILSSDEYNRVHESQSSFWSEWKFKLEQQKHVADKSRVLEKLIPGVQTSRFISKDMEYIESVVYSLIESVKREKKRILKDVLTLAQTYGLERSKVLLHFLSAVLVSEAWSIEDIMDEVPKEEILACAQEAIKCLTTSVYAAIDGHDKQRLAFFYNLLSECYLQLEGSKESLRFIGDLPHEKTTTRLAQFCKLVGSECNKVSFIRGLDFKNIAGLQGLNFDRFNWEICAHIDETSVEALAKMVQNLALVDGGLPPEGLLSSKYVYMRYILDSMVILEGKAESENIVQRSEDLVSFISEIEQTYDTCKKYIRFMEHTALSDILERFFTIILPVNRSLRQVHFDSIGKECLLKLIKVWLRPMNDMEELHIPEERFASKCSITCFQVLIDLLLRGTLSPNQGWCTLVKYVECGPKCSSVTETLQNFVKAMVFGGCGFEAIHYVFSKVSSLLPGESDDTNQPSVAIRDIQKLYLSILEPVLQEIACGLPQHQSLHYVLSSLSKSDGNLDELKDVRLSVWDRMSKFSKNLELPHQTRVYILELMQFISGEQMNSEKFSSEGPPAYLLPWEGWKYTHDEAANLDNLSDDAVTKHSSSNFTNTLVALKSSQLVTSISPSLEITPEDILTVKSATSCFTRVSEMANSDSHIDALIALLAEWAGLFISSNEGNAAAKEELPDTENNWNGYDWDEGWESFQEESIEKETNKTKTAATASLHPLHICWTVVIRKLIAFSRSDDALKLLDSNSVSSHGVLMDEEDTRTVIQEANYFLALKVALLLPYEAIQLRCLDAFENKLKEGGITDDIANDHMFFVLLLSSGILSTIITKDSYGTVFSYICVMVGNFCRRFQALASKNVSSDENVQNLDSLFVRILIPCFIAELVKAHQHVLAGLMVTKLMHANVSVGLINIAEASLRRFLETQLQDVKDEESRDVTSFCKTLSNALTSLWDHLADSIQSAISVLPTTVR